MSVLADIIAAYTTALDALTGFTHYPPNREAKDPDGSFHRKFNLKLGSGSIERGPTQGGGELVEYFAPLELTVTWEPADSEATTEATITNDTTLILAAMHKASNRPAGCRSIRSTSSSRTDKKRPIEVTFNFVANYLEPQDVT